MKLELSLPVNWEQRAVDEGVMLQAPSKISGMLVTPIEPARLDPEEWVKRAFMYRARDEDGAPRNQKLSPFAMDTGWAGLRLDGDLGEQARMVLYLAFMDYAVTVVGMCRRPAELPAWRDDIVALIASAKPNFTDDTQLLCLAHQLGAPPPRSTPDRRARHPIAGWQRSFAGGQPILSPRRDPHAGTLRISTGLAPLRTASELIARALPAGEPVEEIEAPRIETTDEGEYAVFAAARTPRGLHSLAIVFGDLEYTQIEAVVTAPERYDEFRATVHELAYSTTLGLGAGRWRRFYFEPPPGWAGIARPRSSLWLSPDHPRRHQVMRVFDARPPLDHERPYGARMFETLSQEFFREPPKGPAVYYTADDLECRVFVYTAQLPNRREPIRALEGTIATDAYTYLIRFEFEPALLESSTAAFEQVVASFRPLPERRATTELAGAALDYWTE